MRRKTLLKIVIDRGGIGVAVSRGHAQSTRSGTSEVDLVPVGPFGLLLLLLIDHAEHILVRSA